MVRDRAPRLIGPTQFNQADLYSVGSSTRSSITSFREFYQCDWVYPMPSYTIAGEVNNRVEPPPGAFEMESIDDRNPDEPDRYLVAKSNHPFLLFDIW